MTTTEHEPTADLAALQRLPVAEPASDGLDPTCATTGVATVPESPSDPDPGPGAESTADPAQGV